MIETRIHGENGEAEFGLQQMTYPDAMSYLQLLKTVNWFQHSGEWLNYVDSVLEIDSEPKVLNIYTKAI